LLLFWGMSNYNLTNLIEFLEFFYKIHKSFEIFWKSFLKNLGFLNFLGNLLEYYGNVLESFKMLLKSFENLLECIENLLESMKIF